MLDPRLTLKMSCEGKLIFMEVDGESSYERIVNWIPVPGWSTDRRVLVTSRYHSQPDSSLQTHKLIATQKGKHVAVSCISC